MSFPTDPRDVAVELYVNSGSGWRDITSDVLLRDGIRITRGRANEAASVSPSTCSMTLNNRLGKYSPKNPTGPYYGTLGRNTPLRVAVRTEKDSFTRTVSSGWGSADTGGVWTGTGAGGSVLASDFNVSGGVGTHSVPTTVAYRLAYLGGSVYRDVDVSAQVALPFANVLGGDVEPLNLMVSGLSSTDYFMSRVVVSAAEVVSISILHFDGTVVVSPVTVAGLTFTGQALRARIQVEGQTLRAKVWDATKSEPYAWNAEGRTDRLAGRAAGWVGVRSGVGGGNTNTFPIVFSYDNFEVRSCRFAGEVSSWPSQWDISGNDVYTPIQAAGPLRRLGQGQSPLKSTYRRGNETMSPAALVYWPVEDGSTASTIASGIGGSPMIVDGPAQFAANSDFVSSAPIAKVNGSSWSADVQGAPNTGAIQTMCLLSIPAAGELAEATILRVNCSGTAPFWDFMYTVSGGARLKAFDANRAQILDSGPIGLGLDGIPRQVSVDLKQNGANIDWVVTSLAVGANVGPTASNTLAGRTVGALTGIIVSPYKQLTSAAIGHISARNYITSMFNLSNQLKAYAGETAKLRIERLCSENSVPFSWLWDGVIASPASGPQRRDTFLNLVNECAAADMGSLYERRSTTGIGYRNRSGHYNQPAVLALDYAAGHISPPFAPVDDDQNLRNDVTVTRLNGSTSQVTQATGPLALTSPSSGTGVGRYDTAVTLNVNSDAQVPDLASWLLHLGTVDVSRYPTVKVGLAKIAANSPALDRAALSVNVDDRITIDNPKPGMDPNQISQLVRGYTEDISAFSHDLTFNCAPEKAYQVFVLDSATMGKLDSSSSTLTSSLTTTATSMSVTSTAEVWTTAAGDMPIPITVAGEAMTVTAVSGTTSPQTFTVTRSVNGVVKTHSAGEQVHLTRDATIAL